jgi:transcriptional regulator with XRE-family HTH domain
VPGNVSKYIRHAATEIRPGDKVVLACRESGRAQRKNMRRQIAGLRHAARALGATVVDLAPPHVGSGAEPYWLVSAARIARAHGAKILAESTDRLIRHPGYHSEEWFEARARACDLEELAFITEGVVLATLVAPDADAAEVRAYQSKRGSRATARPATRPGQLRRRRQELLPRVLEMLSDGQSIRQIARVLNLPRRTARRWEGHFLAGRDLVKGD